MINSIFERFEGFNFEMVAIPDKRQIIIKTDMIKSKQLLFLFTFSIGIPSGFAQEGGPPMLTDDARVADFKEWELNTSFLISVTKDFEIATPHVDLNYGLLPNLQLKLEAPLWLQFSGDETKTEIGDVIAGVKYRFMDEEKSFVSMATFPQYTVYGEKGFLLPVFIEKTFGKYLTGIGVGHFFGEENIDRTEIGALVGYKHNSKLDVMLEFFYIKNHFGNHNSNGFINMGFRQDLSDHFVILASFGTQVVTPAGMERERFISFIGLRSLF